MAQRGATQTGALAATLTSGLAVQACNLGYDASEDAVPKRLRNHHPAGNPDEGFWVNLNP